MIELELLGVGADGETLVFTDAEGERYAAPITDELRGATRRDRPRIEAAPDPARQSLRPRDIQALLRAGVTPEEIATRHGMDIAAITRYEAPVQAEKDYALQRALATTIGSVSDGPAMGDLVVDRLAARGVDPASLVWAAQREANGPWQILLTFVQGAAEHGAHWLLPSSGVLEAVDQEAQWLTETVSTTPAASIFTPLPQSDRSGADLADLEEVRAREAIIDQLNAARGKRQEIEYDLDEDEAAALAEEEAAKPSISARIYSLAHARTKEEPDSLSTSSIPLAPAEPPAANHDPQAAAEPAEPDADSPAETASRTVPATPERRGADTTSSWLTSAISSPTAPAKASKSSKAEPAPEPVSEDAESLPGLESLPAKPAESKKSKSRRRSVPSWDEIVFGAKPQ